MLLKNTFLVITFLGLILLSSCRTSDSDLYYYNNRTGLGGSGTCNNCCCDTCGDSETCDSVLTVTTMQGLPVEGAIVTVYYEGTTIHITNSNGQVPLTELEDGAYVVTVDVDGYERVIETFTVEENICPDISVIIYNPELTTCDATFTVPSEDGSEGIILHSVLNINGDDYSTDGLGSIVVTGLEDGTYPYTITFTAQGQPEGYPYEGEYTVTGLDCSPVMICPIIFQTTDTGISLHMYNNPGTPAYDETFIAGAGGYIIIGVLPAGSYHYLTTSGPLVEGDYVMPSSGACPWNPYYAIPD